MSNIFNIMLQHPNFKDDLLKIYYENETDSVKTIQVLKTTRHKSRLAMAKRDWNKHPLKKYRINKNIIKTLVKAFKEEEWKECLELLELQALELEKRFHRQNHLGQLKGQ